MMNYEVNPFQDYESIAVDELKDQANSLLNLVTEEQRPLRVCMNNGKEFLPFPQDLLAPDLQGIPAGWAQSDFSCLTSGTLLLLCLKCA